MNIILLLLRLYSLFFLLHVVYYLTVTVRLDIFFAY